MKGNRNSEEIFAHMPVGEALRTMCLPAIISNLIILIYNWADTYFIGKTDNPSMVAGVSLILPVFNLTLCAGTLFGVGGGALIPKLLAVKNKREAERAAMYCIRMAVLVAGAFSLILGLFMRPILTLLGANETMYAYSRIYVLMVLVCGGIPTILTNVLAGLLRSVSLSRQASIGVAMGGLLNIALDPLFMFVLLPKGNEVLGIGIATLISNVASCTYCMIVLWKRQKELELSLRIRGIDRSSVKAILVIGIPGAVNTLLFDVDYMILDKLMASYSDEAMAAIGIVLKAERLPIQTGLGLCQGMVPLIAYNFTTKHYDRMKSVVKKALFAGILISVIVIPLYEIFAPQIVSFFIGDTLTVELGAQFLRPRSLATMFMFLSFFGVHLYQAFGDGKTAFLFGFCRWAVLNIPMLYIFNAVFGMAGLPWSQVIADVIVSAVSLAIAGRYLKKLQ